MLSHWVVGVLVIGLMFTVASSSDGIEKPKRSNGGSIKIRRQHTSRQPALSNVNPSKIDFTRPEDDGVQYDPSGLGFEFKLPFQEQEPFKANFEAKHVTPDDESKTPDALLKTVNHEYNPVYHTSPSPEPTYSPSSTQAPSYIEFPYVDAPSVPAYFPDYSVPKSSYKPETPVDISYSTANPNNYNNNYLHYCPKVGGYESQCRPTKDCAVWYDLVLITSDTSCKLPGGEPGTCCPDLPYNSVYSWPKSWSCNRFQLQLFFFFYFEF
jgi:hypothetical protein